MKAGWADLESDDFVHPHYRALYEAIAAHGAPSDTSAEAVLRSMPEGAAGLVTSLSVEGLAVTGVPDERFAGAYVVRLRELTALRRIEQVSRVCSAPTP